MSPRLRLHIWSHDLSGLGHTARALAIAGYLSDRYSDSSILLVTDLPIIGRLRFPPNVDYVRVPSLAGDNEFGSVALKSLDPASTLRIRRKILQGVAKTFRPDMIVVERDPLSLPNELERVLTFMRGELPQAKVIWALTDVVGEPDSVVQSWKAAGVYGMLDSLCDEVWVHGDRALFDQASQYHLPPGIAAKVFYTGYLRSPQVNAERIRREVPKQPRSPLVLVTTGGGAAGYPLVSSYLDFLEARSGRVHFDSVIVTGPMIFSAAKLKARAERVPRLIFHRFSRHLLEYVSSADLVVSTGGYNTHCANLTYGKQAIVAPGMRPPNERLLRGRVFEGLGITRVIAPTELGPERLGDMVTSMALNGEALWSNGHAPAISMDGLERIADRIETLAGTYGGRPPNGPPHR